MIECKMNRWSGKVAMVTGASSGIGAALAKSLTSQGVIVVGMSRRLSKLRELFSTEIGKNKFYPIECDVTKEEDILKAFKWVEKELGGVDVLVNNAGINTMKPIIESNSEECRNLIETNLIAPAIFAREAILSMKKRNAAGHIVNINSIAGQFAESISVPLGMYCPSKYGLRALSTELRHEITTAKLNIKVTNISPGAVDTNMVRNLMPNIDSMSVPMLQDIDVANAVVYTLGTPEGVEVSEITLTAKK
ncbi:PREDICTED: farnesol dehydrogenase-like [Eufriesea mexicana]|uniref:farnesol dehydrogenase-like n=1 Tax=Eufriesea mexicana TaxID=516756 RepID=UPI00083BDBAE|nr:PREDICTED: farnesol dehydrogenase-like [Eufriesea mexicana]